MTGCVTIGRFCFAQNASVAQPTQKLTAHSTAFRVLRIQVRNALLSPANKFTHLISVITSTVQTHRDRHDKPYAHREMLTQEVDAG